MKRPLLLLSIALLPACGGDDDVNAPKLWIGPKDGERHVELVDHEPKYF